MHARVSPIESDGRYDEAACASDQASAALRQDATSQTNSRQSTESRVYTVSGFDLKPGATT